MTELFYPNEAYINAHMSNEERYKKIADRNFETYKFKNERYGDSFAETVQELGLIASVTRILDKTNRLKQLVKNDDLSVGDESLMDTYLDLANYCIMSAMEIEKGIKYYKEKNLKKSIEIE